MAVAVVVPLVLGACTAASDSNPSASGVSVAPSSAPSASVAATPSAAAEPSTIPSEPAPAGPPRVRWDGGTAFDGVPNGMLADGDTWIIGGWANPKGPAAWTSTDLTTWTPAEVPDPQPHDEGFRGSGLGPMIRLGDSILSYGTFIGCCDGRGVLGWRSADGTSWEVIESSSPLFEKGFLLRDIVVGDQALVAVEAGFGSLTGRIWQWTDETSWVDVTVRTDQATDYASGVVTNAVTWGSDRFAVVGFAGDPETNTGIGMSWVSTDGATWESATEQDAFLDTELTHVVPAADGGFLALGVIGREIGPRVPVVLRSPDGLRWEKDDFAPIEPDTYPTALMVVDGGYLALTAHFPDGDSVLRAWTSDDGDRWAEAGRLDGEFLAAETDGRTILVATADPEPGQPTEITLHRGRLGNGE